MDKKKIFLSIPPVIAIIVATCVAGWELLKLIFEVNLSTTPIYFPWFGDHFRANIFMVPVILFAIICVPWFWYKVFLERHNNHAQVSKVFKRKYGRAFNTVIGELLKIYVKLAILTAILIICMSAFFSAIHDNLIRLLAALTVVGIFALAIKIFIKNFRAMIYGRYMVFDYINKHEPETNLKFEYGARALQVIGRYHQRETNYQMIYKDIPGFSLPPEQLTSLAISPKTKNVISLLRVKIDLKSDLEMSLSVARANIFKEVIGEELSRLLDKFQELALSLPENSILQLSGRQLIFETQMIGKTVTYSEEGAVLLIDKLATMSGLLEKNAS